MAPPTARARKEQTLRVYGNHGFIVESETSVVGVPKTDCFYVKDMMRVEQEDADANDSSSTKQQRRLLLNVTFEVVFVKSTWFEELITRTARSEIKKIPGKYGGVYYRQVSEKWLYHPCPTTTCTCTTCTTGSRSVRRSSYHSRSSSSRYSCWTRGRRSY